MDAIDSVPLRVGDVYEHHNGLQYVIIGFANRNPKSDKYKPQVVYRGLISGELYTKETADFISKMKLVETSPLLKERNEDGKAAVYKDPNEDS